ncbi:helix-turn-helix domain-containing protein [Naasia lichenicola]|uniref:Helix-turn-helix domain-containing protein n=1 Tax=Naasia lichenicola TaxID=2565933 RepID=A0A4S4FP62_9MICO|nr:helix-turn-helix domain-containing protein [Naasia lichenicola]THG31066.1 helix-turn-helix domain-containing protein [Naasia lichenicola]
MTLSESQFLTVAEVADALGVPRMRVYRLVHSGQLPATRFGHSFRVPADAVAALLASMVEEPVGAS